MINGLNAIINGIGSVLMFFIDFLPTSPFLYMENIVIESELLGYVNYLFPVSTMVSHLQIFVVAVGLYYLYRVVLRWLKVAGS